MVGILLSKLGISRLSNQRVFLGIWLLLGVILLTWALSVATPKNERILYSDIATHVMIASSTWVDGDLKYSLNDLQRFREDYPTESGPRGLFLKQAGDGSLFFAKPYLYGAVAAPFYALFGVDGFTVLNGLCLVAIGLTAGFALLTALGLGWALLASVAFVIPAAFLPWVFVPHPDLFIAALLASGCYFLVRDQNTRLWQVLGALILGAALHEKIPFIFALPFILAAVPAKSWRWRGVLAALIALSLLLFSMPNIAVDGSLFTYQGLRFGVSGNPYPLEAGWTPPSRGFTSHVFDPVAVLIAILSNLGLIWEKLLDFLVGRQTGIVPYFAAGFALLLIRPFFGPTRSLLLLAGLFAYLIVQWLVFPTNGYGGGGSYGSRYLMQALPLVPLAYLNAPPLAGVSKRVLLDRFLKGILTVSLVFAFVMQHRIFLQGNELVHRHFAAIVEEPLNAFRLEKWLLTTMFHGATSRYVDLNDSGRFRIFHLGETERGSWLELAKSSNTSTFVLYKHNPSAIFPPLELISPVDTDTTIELNGQIIWSGRLLGGQPKLVKVDSLTLFDIAFDLLLGREIGQATLQLKVDHVARYSDETVNRPLLRFASIQKLFDRFGDRLIVKDLVAEGAELRRGWSHIEPWGVWSDGLAADIALRVSQGELYYAELVTHAYIPPSREKLEVTFRCNGLVAEQVVYLPKQLQTIRIPCRKRAEDDYLVIGVDVVDPTSPLAEGRGADPRSLGIGLHSVKVDKSN